ncbi:MAG: SMC-Scp complex subunit ScpB [Bernardetiaceae bacterium]|jgi:segregation and condensation protein B|nr:SMC-Scp complex subunit ScpB [Bernardetiaceae bacterium]
MEPGLAFLARHLEALIFCSPHPLTTDEMKACLSEMLGTEVPEADIEAALQAVTDKFADEAHAIRVVRSGGGYQMLTKAAYQASVNIFLKQTSKKKLSQAALETIAIVAYRQPVTKAQIEQIRGVGSDYALQKLLEKGLLEIKGKSDAVGRPLLYGTTPKFMDYFGLNSLKDLPQPKDLAEETNQIGLEPATGPTDEAEQ